MKRSLIGMGILILSTIPLSVFAGPPFDAVRTNVTEVLSVLGDPNLQTEKGKKMKEQRVEAAADKLFDYVELSKRTLGVNWNSFTQEQRREFVQLFRTVLREAWLEKITGYSNEKVEFTKEVALSESTVEVQSIVKTDAWQMPINYRVIKKDNEWKVYDVVVEGVSLVTNYRSQFREILGNNPPDTLFETLRRKVAKK